MQILSRLLIVVVLLGGLAYGSYAFGKYVLSAHLLNETPVKKNADEAVKRSTRAAEAVTRQTDYQGTQPKVELKVLPAGADGEGPAAPPRRSLVRHTEEERTETAVPDTDAAAEKAVAREAEREEQLLSNAARHDSADSSPRSPDRTSEAGSSRSSRSSSRNEDEKKREARRIENNPFADLGTPDTKPDANSPVSGGGVYRGGEAGDVPRKRRRRPKPVETPSTTAAGSSASMVPVPEAETPRPTRSNSRPSANTDSPVPRPEAGATDSPVPQPE